MIILLLALSACQGKTQASVTDEETALQMLQSLQSYEAQVSITFYAQQGESTYTVNQKARQEGAYRMEIVEPQFTRALQRYAMASRLYKPIRPLAGR